MPGGQARGRRVSKKFKNKLCAYCGERSETGDHVIARAFFPEKLRTGLPQVPACFRCNGLKSDLETYLAAVLPVAGNHAITEDLREHVGRRIAKNAKLSREIVEGFEKRCSVSKPNAQATDFRGQVLLDYAAYVGKGLLLHHFVTVLTQDYEARGLAIDAAGQRAFNDMFSQLRQVTKFVEGIHANGALTYRGFAAAEDSCVSSWQVRLYGGLNMGVSSSNYQQGRFDFAAMTIRKEGYTAEHEP